MEQSAADLPNDLSVLIANNHKGILIGKISLQNVQTCLIRVRYHNLADQCSCLTLAFNIPGSGGDVGGLVDTLEAEGGTCD